MKAVTRNEKSAIVAKNGDKQNYSTFTMAEKGKGEIKVPVRNFFLAKRVEEDGDGLVLIGTFVQMVFNNFGLECLTDNEAKHFDYRLNDFTYGDGALVRRRTEESTFFFDDGDAEGTLWRSTFQAKLPLEVEVVKELFPFRILKAKVDIELSSDFRNGQRIRPTLLVARKDKRSNMCISEPKQKVDGKIDYRAVDLAMDRMKKYDFLTPYPEVRYKYDKKKGYCAQYSITFHLFNNGVVELVSTLLPLILVSVLNTLKLVNDINVANDESDGTSDDEKVSSLLDFSSGLALTVVFLMGTVYKPSASKINWFGPDVLYILFIFIALILSSIPESFAGDTFGCRIAGCILFWLSFIFPFSNMARIFKLVAEFSPQKSKKDDFVKDKTVSKWKPEKNSVKSEFIKLENEVGENELKKTIKDEVEDEGYSFVEEEDGKICQITYK